MTTRKLHFNEWKNFFNSLNKQLNHTLVTIEISGAGFGSQTEVRWQLLQGFSVDHKENSLIVFTENINHSISHPKEIYIEESDGNPKTIEIVDKDNNKQLIKLQDLSKKVA